MFNRKILFLSVVCFPVTLYAQKKKAVQVVAPVSSALEKGFMLPPDSIKPSVYWYWMSDNVSAEGVTKDLEAMDKVGIGRAFIGNIGFAQEALPYGTAKLFSEDWWKAMEAAFKTASEKGIQLGLFNSPGWSQSGGPWIKPTQSMRYLTSKEWKVKGPKKISMPLPVDKEDFQPVAVIAFPAPAHDEDNILAYKPVLTTSVPVTASSQLLDGNTENEAIFPDNTGEITIDIAVAKPFTARSLVLYPAATPYTAMVTLQAAADGTNFTTIKQFELNRSNPQTNVGFLPYAPMAIAFPPATAKTYRILFTAVRGRAGLAEIKLSGAPVVEQYMEKQLAKMYQTPLPLWKEYQWQAQAEPEAKDMIVDPTKIMDITSLVSPNGTLHWNVPKGEWIIVRYGMRPTGVTNSPASAEGTGLELDKMNKANTQHHFNNFVGKIQQHIAPEYRNALQWVVADSYETGSQNWTDDMAADFKTAMGYDALHWLPVLSGRIVGSADLSNRFLWDLRRFIADRVAYQYVGGLRDVSHQNGLKLWLENYGHWGFPGEFLQYGGQSDEVGGEFWNEGTLGSIENRAASSSAHIYGKTRVAAESFTAGGAAYVRYPALLKKRGDWSFTEGVNHTLLHVFIEQPYEDKKPGVNAFFGTEFNRNNTWFYQSKGFIDYIRRCNFLLQQGKPVNDVAYFIGDDAPKMTGVRDPELPTGYQFDYINGEAIINRLSIKNGRFVLPDGMSYKLLVLPPLETMRPGVLQKLKELVMLGGVVLGPAPKHVPGLQNYPASDMQLQRTAAELWSGVDGINNKQAMVGKGMILQGMTMEEALALLETPPDFDSHTAEPVLYTHRTTPDADIYFITNQSDKIISFSPAFRITGKQPEWWDAVSGAQRTLPQHHQEQASTIVPLKLDAGQSGFVIFRRPAIGKIAGKNFPEPKWMQTLTRAWTVQFDTAMRGPVKPVTFDKLTDWSKHGLDAIHNYSGKAIYKTTFTMNALPPKEHIVLNLGEVRVIAVVKVNGKPVGSAWTAPWQVDITEAVKAGENKLEIEVVNTWVNRLIGDSKLPEAERKTWTNVNPFKPESKYEPSGLMGPVKISSVKY